MALTARDLVKHKGKSPKILSIAPDATALDAMKLMAEYNVGALLVEGANGIEGILSERDLVRKLDLQSRVAKDTLVREIMTTRVLYVECDQSLEACMALMNEKGIRHLPVYDSGNLGGMISIRDVLREIITEQKTMISYLEQYIRGGAQ